MNFESTIRPISYVKTNAAEMIRHINETHNPIVITQNGEARGVLVDPKTYQEMTDALGILKLISQSEKAIEAGDTVSHSKAMDSVRTVIKKAT